MGKVVKLKEKTAIVEAAEKLVADVKSGRVAAFAVATIGRSEPYTGSASAFEPSPTIMDHKLLLAAIEEMRHEFKHALRGG